MTLFFMGEYITPDIDTLESIIERIGYDRLAKESEAMNYTDFNVVDDYVSKKLWGIGVSVNKHTNILHLIKNHDRFK